MSKVAKSLKGIIKGPKKVKLPPPPEKIRAAKDEAMTDVDQRRARARSLRASGRGSLVSGAATGIKDTLG